MYFPYLRGRQFELLAIRELAEFDLISSNVIPIIEPIKPTATLVKTVRQYTISNKSIGLIHNPQVGNFLNEFNQLKDHSAAKRSFQDLIVNQNILLAHLMNSDSAIQIDSLLSKRSLENLIIMHTNGNYIKTYKEIFPNNPPGYVVTPDATVYRRKIPDNKVLLHDGFKKQKRNADYPPDSFFSENHLYYTDEGCLGFSDYSIVGEQFSEAGFAPYAIAIHIPYFDEEGGLRVRHFVSDSNEDITDPAGKFYQALKKLVDWQSEKNLNTYSMKEFQRHYQDGTYPGLGTIKKLSIMHHIELISKYLDGVE